MSEKESREKNMRKWAYNDAEYEKMKERYNDFRHERVAAAMKAKAQMNFSDEDTNRRGYIQVRFRRTDKDNRTGVSVTARVMGDPPLERSALGKKK